MGADISASGYIPRGGELDGEVLRPEQGKTIHPRFV
jgi:hypothetical protein